MWGSLRFKKWTRITVVACHIERLNLNKLFTTAIKTILNDVWLTYTRSTMYLHHCPSTVKTAFYLTPLKKSKDIFWYSEVPVGNNTLSQTVLQLCTSIEMKGLQNKSFPALAQK